MKELLKPKFTYCLFWTLILLFSYQMSYSQKNTPEFVTFLKESPNLKRFIDKADSLGIQIIYTKINRKTDKKLKFTTQYFNVDENNYFYPASTVKLPAVVLALEKLKKYGISINAPMQIASAFEGHEGVEKDSSSENGYASVAHYAKKILIVSDNDAFNRLYEFIGQKEFNEKLHQKGYTSARILHRLQIPYSIQQNKMSPELKFGKLDENNKLLGFDHVFPAQNNLDISYSSKKSIYRGDGYMQNGVLVHKPFEFTHKNEWSLLDQHQFLKSLIFPNQVPKINRFDIREADRDFVLKYMSMLPFESDYPKYDPNEYYDSYVKFLMFGDSKEAMPKHIKIYNKVGDAYGYLIDNAYFKDSKNDIEFILSAVIYCNSDGIFNDDNYDYQKIGFPFMGELGRAIYEKELKNKGTN